MQRLTTLALGLALGCLPQDQTGADGGASSGSASGDGAVATSKSGQACLDMATVFATASKRCGGNYDAERAQFIRDTANGDCESVSIRNETELRTQCFPSFNSISCADLLGGRLAPSCAEQIIRSK